MMEEAAIRKPRDRHCEQLYTDQNTEEKASHWEDWQGSSADKAINGGQHQPLQKTGHDTWNRLGISSEFELSRGSNE